MYCDEIVISDAIIRTVNLEMTQLLLCSLIFMYQQATNSKIGTKGGNKEEIPVST